MKISSETIELSAEELATAINDYYKPILDQLMYGSYKANRGYGLTHEQLVKQGIGNNEMRLKYESENIKP